MEDSPARNTFVLIVKPGDTINDVKNEIFDKMRQNNIFARPDDIRIVFKGKHLDEGTTTYEVLVDDVPIEDAIEPTSVRDLFIVPATIELAGAEIELVSMFSRETRLGAALKTVVDDYRFAQAWDPKGWFWAPADAARNKIGVLEYQANSDF